jgi:hypothetical protein
VPQVVDDRLTDLDRQREGLPVAPFALNAQLAAYPVKIIEFEKGHFAGAQSQAC